MKLHVQAQGTASGGICSVVAKLAGKDLATVVDSDEARKEAAYKAFNPFARFPVLETAEGNLFEATAIAKFLANGHATLLGSSPVERAQIDQWVNWVESGVLQAGAPAVNAILGQQTDVTQAAFNDSVKSLKENVRAIDAALSGNWLVGGNVTVADIALAGSLASAFQLVLDQGFSKAASKACAWFARVAALPEFVAVFGKVKMGKKACKPVIKSEEKPKKAAAAAQAAKPKPAADEKPKNPLDLLPPTSFDLFNFKTLYVNHPDKKGEGFDEFKRQLDREGWAFWFLHYEKYGDEGQESYKFANLLEGFVQRLEGFRKLSFGRICMLGEEPNLEIMGVLLIRGQVIPQECIDHPQFEYMRARKMSLDNADDEKDLREFFSSKEEVTTCRGMKVEMALWHK